MNIRRIWGSTPLHRQVRVVFYVLVVLVLFLVRGPERWRDALGWRGAPSPRAEALVVAGGASAPTLLDVLARGYTRDYPAVTVELRAEGTAHALQALLDGDAQVALISRLPLAAELEPFVRSHGGAPICEPIALAGLALLTAVASGVDSLAWSQLESLLRDGADRVSSAGEPVPIERLYVEDPNLGTWDALLAHFEEGRRPTLEDSGPVYFVADRAALFAALRDDPHAIGVVSSIFLADDRAPEGLRIVALGGPGGEAAAMPTHTNVGHGVYPLRHHFYVACRADAAGEPAKFVTFASSARGQRLVERAGFLPARQVLREVLLDDRPLGAR